MTDKFIALVNLIYDERAEITSITRSGTEYYFYFRNYAFSVLRKEQGLGMFAYTKWRGPIEDLIRSMDSGLEGGDLTVVPVKLSTSEAREKIAALYDWIDRKSLGLDELFSDLGL